MKVTINGEQYPSVPIGQWTYEEADEVKRVTGLTVGQVALGELTGDSLAYLAYAVVSFMRMHEGVDPIVLRAKKIDEIEVDLRDEDANEKPGEDDDGPPAEDGAAGAGESPAAVASSD